MGRLMTCRSGLPRAFTYSWSPHRFRPMSHSTARHTEASQAQTDPGDAAHAFSGELAAYLCDGDPGALSGPAAWFEAADRDAMALQRILHRRRAGALWLTLAGIFFLVAWAVALKTPALQVLCPVAVYLMLVYFDRVRGSALLFRFTALRLLAETLRVALAARHQPAHLQSVLSSRGISTHPVTALAARACTAAATLLKAPGAGEAPDDAWARWLGQQADYYRNACARDQYRARRARRIFNTAFQLVGVIGVACGVWSLADPAATATTPFRVAMAVASALGGTGLACISYVRELKAFEQSFDYAHMHRLFLQASEAGAESGGCADMSGAVVSESIDEHARWALRMAGHFAEVPGGLRQAA